MKSALWILAGVALFGAAALGRATAPAPPATSAQKRALQTDAIAFLNAAGTVDPTSAQAPALLAQGEPLASRLDAAGLPSEATQVRAGGELLRVRMAQAHGQFPGGAGLPFPFPTFPNGVPTQDAPANAPLPRSLHLRAITSLESPLTTPDAGNGSDVVADAIAKATPVAGSSAFTDIVGRLRAHAAQIRAARTPTASDGAALMRRAITHSAAVSPTTMRAVARAIAASDPSLSHQLLNRASLLEKAS